jgi:hypothetical protein
MFMKGYLDIDHEKARKVSHMQWPTLLLATVNLQMPINGALNLSGPQFMTPDSVIRVLLV